ncbi:MAG TPA: RsmG family class I SAM-dependent methyltransferase [Pyrinomonadaceae bacterium]|nr:RsmG family class I SAM-dependent methyltransferase [Pyrinomonadaceae bacterium]
MGESKLPPAGEFDKALAESAPLYGVEMGERERRKLTEYFELISLWNKRLHLVAPCPPAEFATRHVLESLMAARFLDDDARVVDLGSGGGLPVIPCLVVKPQISATLVEASEKKAVFLREALWRLDERRASRVIAERFERMEAPEADFITCRAIERFTELLPRVVEWASHVPTLLLFGGESLRARLEELGLCFDSLKAPGSERRFLFVVRRK